MTYFTVCVAHIQGPILLYVQLALVGMSGNKFPKSFRGGFDQSSCFVCFRGPLFAPTTQMRYVSKQAAPNQTNFLFAGTEIRLQTSVRAGFIRRFQGKERSRPAKNGVHRNKHVKMEVTTFDYMHANHAL